MTLFSHRGPAVFSRGGPFRRAAALAPYSGFDPDAAAFLTRMAEKPTTERAQLYDAMFRAAKTHGFWAKMVALWVHAAHTPLAGRMNWKGNAAYDCVPVNNPAFTVDRGFKGDGASSYLDTGFNPGVANHPLHQLGNSSLWIRSNTDNVSSGSLAGWFDLTPVSTANRFGTTINPRTTSASNAAQGRMHTNNAVTTTNGASPSAVGLFVVTRGSTGSYQFYRNKTAMAVVAGSQDALAMTTNGNYRLGSINDTSYRACQFAAGGIGAHLTQGDVDGLNDWLQTWLTAVGVA